VTADPAGPPGRPAAGHRIYLDGNSLGPLLPGVVERVQLVLQQWSDELIGGWNDCGWWELPLLVGDRIAPLLGAGPGQVVVGDSTTIMLHKLLGAAVLARPGRRRLVTHADNFPTDRHAIDAVAEVHGLVVDAVPASALHETLDDDAVALVATHVDYRTGERLEMADLTAAAHGVGALTIWDLSHSVGAMALDLDADRVDLAVGCTYKYLNGGPGAPAFAYVAERHLADLDHPLRGWVGHVAPFSMDEVHHAAPGIRRLLSGTPPVLALAALDAALDAFSLVDLAELRLRSVELTSMFIALADERLTPHGFSLVTPRDAHRRGSHVSLRHPHGYEVIQAATDAGVVGDYREPGLCRFGFAPLYLGLGDVEEAVDRLEDVMRTEAWRAPRFAVRRPVT
jgi:kynureninase